MIFDTEDIFARSRFIRRLRFVPQPVCDYKVLQYCREARPF